MDADLKEVAVGKVHSHEHSEEDVEGKTAHEGLGREAQLQIIFTRGAVLKIKEFVLGIFKIGEDVDPIKHQKVVGHQNKKKDVEDGLLFPETVLVDKRPDDVLLDFAFDILESYKEGNAEDPAHVDLMRLPG